MAPKAAFRVIEPTYAADRGLMEFEAELNALAQEGYDFAGVVPVREIRGDQLEEAVNLVVMRYRARDTI